MCKQKRHLVTAYRALAFLGMDDHTYTHLSAKLPKKEAFYIYPFGLTFNEVTQDNLLVASYDGTVQAGEEEHYNATGYAIHGSVYKARPDVHAVFHVHTPSIVAVSAIEEGLLPISQWALHFYNQVCYHEYNSLILHQDSTKMLIHDLGEKWVMLMRNHGALVCGRTVAEALFYVYHLEKAAQTQCLALSMGRPLRMPSSSVCEQAVKDLLSFETSLGERDIHAWERLLSQKEI